MSDVAFYVGNVPVQGRVILAPMDGFSDLPFRLICRELGSAMSYTEFVNVDELAATRKRDAKCWRKLVFDPTERPMTFQIYGHDVDRMITVAERLQTQEPAPDIVDINMGCYVRNIAERGAGSGMLRFPDRIARLFAGLSQRLRLPVTGKMRLGWDPSTRVHVEVARILEDNGARLIAVHGRTKSQGYGGQADWDAIAAVRQAVRVPVIGNGDVKTVADIERLRVHTGCDAVMIGRAAIGNPWIFAGKDREQVTLADKVALMRRHLQLNLDFYGQRFGLVLFRKHAARYIHGLPDVERLRVPLLTARTVAAFDEAVGEWADAAEPVA
ncbi:MAG: tRNA-dihydrouridine synthase [Anaerolineales bacterium]|nr:tRNA-dihydrouridine synthase [Anaerolineales bacterium]